MSTSPFRIRHLLPPALTWALVTGLSGLGLTFSMGGFVERHEAQEARQRAERALQRRGQLLLERIPAIEPSLRWLEATEEHAAPPLLSRAPLAHVGPARIQAGLLQKSEKGLRFVPRLITSQTASWITAQPLNQTPLPATMEQAAATGALVASAPFRVAPAGPDLVALLVARSEGFGACMILPLADLLACPPGDADGAFVVRAVHAGAPLPPGSFQTSLVLAGRTWTLELAGPLPSQGLSPHLIILLGLLSSLFVASATAFFAVGRSRNRLLTRRKSRATQKALLRFQHLVRESPLAMIEWGPSGRIVSWNPAAEQVFGFRAEEILGKAGLPILFPLGAADAFLDAYRAAQAGQVPPTALASGMRRNGEAVLGEWSHVPSRNASGLVQGVTSLVLDVTRKHEAALHTQQHQRMESLGVLAGGIAHDFNNILGILTGYLEQTLQHLESDPVRARQHLEKVDQAVFRASGLARQMLAYAGKVPPRIEAVDLNRTLAGLMDLLHASLPKLHSLETELAEALPVVRMDEAQLQQVVINLATNAAEALGHQPGQIWIRTRHTELQPSDLRSLPPGLPMEAGPVVVLEVEDNGCGMDRKVLDHLFDPFFTTKFSGRGLGLSVILGILKAHGASLRIRSAVGQGSRFEVLLPLHPAPDLGASRGASTHLPVQPATLLFADDEPMLRELAHQALSMDGHTVLLAEDGEVALQLFEAHRDQVSLVILDVTMPRMGGLEVYRQIRAQAPQLPILLSSGYSEQELPEDHTTHFLPKPYRIHLLRDRAAALLAHAKSGASLG